MEVPQIDIGKSPQEPLNVKHMLMLPAETPFGNMGLKHTKIIQRIDHINKKLQYVYKDWKTIDREEPNPSHDPTNHLLWIEEICYFLRVTTDELISLCYLFYLKKKNNDYPTNIKIHSIGILLGKLCQSQNKEYDFTQRFEGSKFWLETLNNITNAYKHSFINSDLNIIGRNEPCAPVLHLPYNNLEKNVDFIVSSLAQIIDGFNNFYHLTIDYIRDDVWGGTEKYKN